MKKHILRVGDYVQVRWIDTIWEVVSKSDSRVRIRNLRNIENDEHNRSVADVEPFWLQRGDELFNDVPPAHEQYPFRLQSLFFDSGLNSFKGRAVNENGEEKNFTLKFLRNRPFATKENSAYLSGNYAPF